MHKLFICICLIGLLIAPGCENKQTQNKAAVKQAPKTENVSSEATTSDIKILYYTSDG